MNGFLNVLLDTFQIFASPGYHNAGSQNQTLQQIVIKVLVSLKT
mgnify:CR=1 FL=1